MGNYSNCGGKSNQFKIQEWEFVKEGKYYNILKHKIDGTKVKQYTLNYSQGDQYDKQIQLYHQRKQHLDNVVQLLDYIQLGKQGFCSSHFNVKVYIENIQIKLSQIRNLPETKTILVIHQMLVGFKNLFVTYGAIDINSQLIGINQFSEIKVWINQDYSINHPNINPLQKNQNSNKESSMIAKILEISEKTTENKKFSKQFQSFLHEIQKPFTFTKLIQNIRNYANNRKAQKNNIQKKDEFRQLQKFKVTISNIKKFETNQKNQQQLNPNLQIIKSPTNLFNFENLSQKVFLNQNQQQNKSFYSQKKLLPIIRHDSSNANTIYSKREKQDESKKEQQKKRNHHSSIWYNSNYDVKQQYNMLSPKQVNYKNNELNRVQVSKVIEDLIKPKSTYNSVPNSPKNQNNIAKVPNFVSSVDKNELINQINQGNTISNQNLQQTSQFNKQKVYIHQNIKKDIPIENQLTFKIQEQIKNKTTENNNKKPFNTKNQQIPNQIQQHYNKKIQQTHNQIKLPFNTKNQQIPNQILKPYNISFQQIPNQTRQSFNTKNQQIPNQILQPYNINFQQIPNQTRQPFNTKNQLIPIHTLQPLNTKKQQTHNQIQQPFNTKNQQILNQRKQSYVVPHPNQQYMKQQYIPNLSQNKSFNYMLSHSNQLQKVLQKHNQPKQLYNINNPHIFQQRKQQQFNKQKLNNNLITNPTYNQKNQIFNNMVIPNPQQQLRQQNYIQQQRSFNISSKSNPLQIYNQYQYQPLLDNQLFTKKNENNEIRRIIQKKQQFQTINNQIMKGYNISNELKVQMRTSMINEQSSQQCFGSNYNFEKKMQKNPIKENKNIKQFQQVKKNYMTPTNQIKSNMNINTVNTIRNKNNQHNLRSFSEQNIKYNSIQQQSYRRQIQSNIKKNQIQNLKHLNQNVQTKGNYKKKNTYQVIYNKPKPIQQYIISSINNQYYPSFINKQIKTVQNKSSLEHLFQSNVPSQQSNIDYKENQKIFDINAFFNNYNLEKNKQLTHIEQFKNPLNFLSQNFIQPIIPQQSESKKIQNNFQNNNILLYPLSTIISKNPLDQNLDLNYNNQFSTIGIYSKPYQFGQTLKFEQQTSSIFNNKLKYEPLNLEQIKFKNEVYDSSINQNKHYYNNKQKMKPFQTNDRNNQNLVSTQQFQLTFERKIENSLENTSQIRKEVDIPRFSYEKNQKLSFNVINLQEHAYNIQKKKQFSIGQRSIDLTSFNYPKQIYNINAMAIDIPLYKKTIGEGNNMIKKQDQSNEKKKKYKIVHFINEQNNETFKANQHIHEQIEINSSHQLSRMKNCQKCSYNYEQSDNSFIENKQKIDNKINTEQNRKLAVQISHKVFSQGLPMFSQSIQSQMNLIRKRKFTNDYLQCKSDLNDNYTYSQKNINEIKSKFSDNLYVRLQGVESEKYQNYDNLWIKDYYSIRSISNNMKSSQVVQEIIIGEDFDNTFQINKLEKK